MSFQLNHLATHGEPDSAEPERHPEEVQALPSNPFPDKLTVVPKNPEDVEEVAALFSASPAVGIDKVDYVHA